MPTTWRVDIADGSDYNGGDSWTPDFTNTDGVSYGNTTFTSATGGFTGKAGRWMYIEGKGRRKIISVASDTSVTLNQTVSGASGLRFTVGGALRTCVCSGVAYVGSNGDTYLIKKSPDPESIGTASHTQYNSSITLSSPTWKVIERCCNLGVVSSNVSVAASVSLVVGDMPQSATYTIATAFTTGKAWYKRLYSRFLGGSVIGNTTNGNYALSELTTSYASRTTLNFQWGYDFGSGVTKTIQNYMFVCYSTANARPKNWTFEGSNNNSTWTVLDTRSDQVPSQTLENWYSIASPSAYRYYRINVSAVQSGTTCQIAFMGYDEGAYDFSAYDGISFRLNVSGISLTVPFKINLCSDLTGDTPVDTFTISPDAGISGWSISGMFVVVRSKGSSLGSSIRSISISFDSDPGTSTLSMALLNIVAIQTSGPMSHESIIGRNTSEYSPWYMVDMLDDNGRIVLSASSTYTPQPIIEESGSGTWYRIKASPLNTSSSFLPSNGNNDVTLTGGIDPSTDLQVGETYIRCVGQRCLYPADGLNCTNLSIIGAEYAVFAGGGVLGSNITYTARTVSGSLSAFFSNSPDIGKCNITINSTTTARQGLRLGAHTTGTDININTMICQGGSLYSAIEISRQLYNVSVDSIFYLGTYAVIYLTGGYNSLSIGTIYSPDVQYIVYALESVNNTLTSVNGSQWSSSTGFIKTNGSMGDVYNNINYSGLRLMFIIIDTCYGITFNNLTLSTATHLITNDARIVCRVYINGLNWDGTLLPSSVDMVSFTNTCFDYVFVIDRFNNSPTDYRVYGNGIKFLSNTSVRHTDSGLSWKIQCGHSNGSMLTLQKFKIGTFYLLSDTTYTISAYMRRSNTALTCGIYVPRHSIPGVTTNKVATVSASQDTWQQISIEVTPTTSGCVDLFAFAYGGSYDCYIDDVAITES